MIALGLVAFLSLLQNGSRAELLLYYDFNDPSNPEQVKDLSGKNNHGDLLGDPDPAKFTDDAGGRSGQAGDRAVDYGVDEDGDTYGAYLEVPSAADGAFDAIVENDSVTISLWAYGGDFQPQNHFIFWFADGDADPRQLGSHAPWSDGNIYFDVAGCCEPYQRVSGPLDVEIYQGTWSHYTFVKDGESTAIYVNGELYLDSGENVMAPLEPITTARFGSGGLPGQWTYNGFMDDIAVWDEAISETAIACLAQGNSPTTCTGGGVVTGDFDADGDLDAVDIDALSAVVRAGTNDPKYDLNGNNTVDNDDRGVWVRDLKKTYFGDADLSGDFTSSDFVAVFGVGEYEDAVAGNSGWADGDWNGDGEFTSGDFVTAFQDGGYEKGPRAAASVPEPSAIVLALLSIGAWATRSRRR
jgi:hypothetical protein